MIRSILAISATLFVTIFACDAQESNVNDGIPSASQAVLSPPPGSPWVSYLPQSAPVGARVRIEGNVGKGALDAGGAPETQHVRVELWKFDDVAGLSYATILGNIPYDDKGDFSGEVVIPVELSPHQEDPDTANFQVVPGTYSLRLHPVDVSLQPFVVTDG